MMNEELNVINIPISRIQTDPKQPRKTFNKEELQSLADSISQYGVLSPINVRQDGLMYIIIAGERRWRAARLAGLKEIPAKIEEVDDKTHRMLSLIENIQREDLNPIEEGMAYASILDQYDMTQEELSSAIGKSRSYIANMTRLTNLEDEIKKFIIDGKLTAGHAKLLLSIPNSEMRLSIARECIEKDLSIKELEALIKKENKGKKKKKKEKENLVSLSADSVAKRLSEELATKVSIRYNKDKTGFIQIEFYNDEAFNDLVYKLTSNS